MRPKNTRNRKSLESSPELTPSRKRLYILFSILIPVVIILLTELGLSLFNYGGDTSLFVPTPDESSKYYGININVASRYFTTVSTIPSPRKDLFLREKPENCYRIFVLGGSSSAGFPYGNNVTFSRILNRRLSDVFPNKCIEIVNTAMTAINSYTQLDFMDEILQYQPDAILIYSGHNEFYGALGVGSMESFGKQRWMVKTTLALQKFKIYLLMRDFITAVKGWFGSAPDEDSNATATLMERIVKSETIPYNSDDYELGKEQFRGNIDEIISMAQEAGVKVIISELVSNVKDNKPFKSVKSDNYPPADAVYKNAMKYEKQGKYNEAKDAYYKAKDLDALRFRAPEDFNNIIHEVAAEHNIPVVPMKSYFESKSPHGIIGNNLMFEHLHPKIEGYFLMADAFFNTMQKEKFVDSRWDEKNIKPSSFYRNNWGFTSLDSIYASLVVSRLKGGWPFKKTHTRKNTFLNFRPSTRVDSIAANIVAGNTTLELGHISLGNYYEKRGELQKAFNEFNALIYEVPFLDLFYEPAVKVLVRMEKYDKALEVLNDMMQYQQTAFAYKWIGQIYLVTNRTTKGIPYMEKAVKFAPNDYVLLYNLGRAYYTTSQFEKGDAVLNQLKNSSIEPQFVSNLDEFRKASIENYKLASSYIKQAQTFLEEKNYNKAHALLQQSLFIQETSAANELLGLFKLIQGSKSEALSYLEKAYAMSTTAGPKLLYNLSNAYYVNAEYLKAKNTFEQLKKSYPDYSDPANLEQKLYANNNKTMVN